MRDRWDIVAKVQLPPSVEGLLLPEGAPVFESRGEFTEYVRWSKYVGRWTEEMSAVRDKVIQMPPLSTRAFFDPQSETSWNNFLSACVLYDPPDDGLIEFASYADLEPIVLSPKPYPGGADLEGLPRMVDPPIRSLWDLTELRDWYWQRVLKRVGEKYLEPQGIDVDALLENIMVEAPGLREEHVERYKRYSRRYYLEVDEHTTVDDVKNALRMIRAMGDARPTAAKPPRDRLTAVQCAVLRREYGSTYRELAQRFRLGSTDSAEEYVKLGKEILQED